MSADSPEAVPPQSCGGRRRSLAELASEQGVEPLASADDLVQPGMFDSDDELDAFLADLYASRRAGTV